MNIRLEINADTPEELSRYVRGLASGMGAAVLDVAANAPELPKGAASPLDVVSSPAPAKRGKKAPAADVVLDQPKNDALMLTIDDARERMRKFNSDGHMDQSAAALAEVGAKKLSEVDPEAGGNPSPKYHALVTRIETLIAEKG